MPWGGLLVRPIGHPPRPVPPRGTDQRSRAYPTLLRVLRWGRYGHRGGPQTPQVGSLACVSRWPFLSRHPFRCVVCGGGFPVSPGWGGGGGGRFSLFLAVLLVCVSPPPLVVVRGRCVCLWRPACARGVCVGVCVVRSWRRGCGCAFRVCWCGCVRVWVCGWGRLGLTAGVGVGVVGVCRGWSLVGWSPLAAVVCGVWCVVSGVWCVAVVCWWGCGWCVV